MGPSTKPRYPRRLGMPNQRATWALPRLEPASGWVERWRVGLRTRHSGAGSRSVHRGSAHGRLMRRADEHTRQRVAGAWLALSLSQPPPIHPFPTSALHPHPCLHLPPTLKTRSHGRASLASSRSRHARRCVGSRSCDGRTRGRQVTPSSPPHMLSVPGANATGHRREAGFRNAWRQLATTAVLRRVRWLTG